MKEIHTAGFSQKTPASAWQKAPAIQASPAETTRRPATPRRSASMAGESLLMKTHIAQTNVPGTQISAERTSPVNLMKNTITASLMEMQEYAVNVSLR